MANSVIKFKGEEKWLGEEFITSKPIKISAHDIENSGFSESEQHCICQAIDFQNEHQRSNPYYFNDMRFSLPIKRGVTKLDAAFKTEQNVVEYIDNLINFGEAITFLSKHKLFKNSIYQYDDKTLKKLKEVKKMLASDNLEIIERDIKNAYINKTAWAIFTGEGNGAGFKAKNGELGEISTARLFDSDKGCEKTAKAMGLTKYEIVEVEVTLKKRTNLHTYQASILDSAFAILEKERLEQFFAEMDHSKIEEKLQEVKAKKINKL